MIKPLIPAMCRLTAPRASVAILDEIQQSLGRVPHVFEAAAHSPVALDMLWRQATAGSRMTLSGRMREIVAERTAELRGYGSTIQRRSVSEGADPRGDDDPKERAVRALVGKIITDQGHHAGFVVEAARQVGVTNAEIIEIISLIAFFTWAHYISSVANTELDVPALIGKTRARTGVELDSMMMRGDANSEERRS